MIHKIKIHIGYAEYIELKFCNKGSLFEDVERFDTYSKAVTRIRELLRKTEKK